MTHRQIRSLTALLVSTALAVVAGMLPAAAHRAAGSTSVAAPADRLITLVTGQRILQSTGTDGRLAVSAAASADASTPLLTFQANGALYVVPAVALHSFGAILDPSLFDTGALSQAETGTPGQMAVQVQWHGAPTPAMPWLLHPVEVAAGVTDGVVTTSSGSGLQSAISAGTLTGIDRISLTGVASHARRPSSGFTLYTLTVNGIDARGAPDTGDAAFLLNTGDARKSAGVGFESWYHGVFKASVPNGHYALLGDFVHFSGGATVNGGGPPAGGDEHMAIVNFTVHGNTTITVDARTATARVTATPPLPTGVGSGSVTWQRNSQGSTGGTSFSTAWSIGGGAPPFKVYVSPGPAPKVGTQGWIASFHFDSPSSSPAAYSYDASYGGQGAIARNQRYAVKTSQLAIVATRYFSDVQGNPAMEVRQSFFPWQVFAFGEFDTFNAPLERTEYVLAGPDLLWLQQVVADAASFNGLTQDSDRVLVPRQESTADWNRGPIGPGVPVDTGAADAFPFVQGCPACTEAGSLEFEIFPYGDNPPGHFGFPNFPVPGLTETDAYTLTQDGVTISAGQDPLGIDVPTAAGPAHFQLQYSVATTATWRTLSTSQATTWTFSSPGSTSAPVPSGWVCFSGMTAGCSVVALMLPDYQLPEDDTGHVASGPVTFQLAISHILGVSIAVNSAQVNVSFDGGATWTPAHVTGSGANTFAVSYRDPAHAGTAAIRIHVTDAGGGVLDQTILNAYAFP